jgi:hypothetical protein
MYALSRVILSAAWPCILGFSSLSFAQDAIGIDGLHSGMTRSQVSAFLAARGVQARTRDISGGNSFEFAFRDPATGESINARLEFRGGDGLNVVFFSAPPSVGFRQYSAWLLKLQSQYSSSLRTPSSQGDGAQYWTCATPKLWVKVHLLEDRQAWLTYNSGDIAEQICPAQKELWSQSRAAYSFAPAAPAPAPTTRPSLILDAVSRAESVANEQLSGAFMREQRDEEAKLAKSDQEFAAKGSKNGQAMLRIAIGSRSGMNRMADDSTGHVRRLKSVHERLYDEAKAAYIRGEFLYASRLVMSMLSVHELTCTVNGVSKDECR